MPSAVGLAPREQRSFTLLVFIHPRCPCSRATVRELERITARTGAALRTRVLFVRPEGMPEGWERTGLWESVAAIAGVTVVSDPEGREAARFGAQTSGHAVLYDPDGRLVFSGGITSSRGHEGDNAGSDAIVDAVSGKAGPVAVRPDVVTTAVFGCPVCVVTTRPSEPLAERSNR